MKQSDRWIMRRLIIVGLMASVLATTVQVANALASWPVVKLGQSGPTVTTVQYLLRHRGYSLTVDGAFGPGTETQAKAFQGANGLAADGIVGSATWAKLVVTLDKGASSDAVRALQTQLNRYGYALSVDGVFGAGTESAVLDFKADHYLGNGSTVGPTTWQELAGASAAGGSYALPLSKSLLPRSEYDDPHHDYAAIDLPVSTGTSAYAVTAGTANQVNDSSCGLGYNIAGDDGATYTYCHFSRHIVASGSRVTPGQLIGYTGSTGNSTGPHLHFGVKYGGVRRCPQNMLLAIYDGASVPAPSSLPTSGCTN